MPRKQYSLSTPKSNLIHKICSGMLARTFSQLWRFPRPSIFVIMMTSKYYCFYKDTWSFHSKRPNLSRKAKTWRKNLVVVVKWRNRANGLLKSKGHAVLKEHFLDFFCCSDTDLNTAFPWVNSRLYCNKPPFSLKLDILKKECWKHAGTKKLMFEE